jgi:hypothetical protein
MTRARHNPFAQKYWLPPANLSAARPRALGVAVFFWSRT